jgi:hypothetical protein
LTFNTVSHPERIGSKRRWLGQAVHDLYPEPERDESIVMAYSPGDDAFVIACDHFMWPGHSRVYRYLT